MFEKEIMTDFIPDDENMVRHVEWLKQNVQPEVKFEGYHTASPEEHAKRRAILCHLLDEMRKTNIGRQILVGVPNFISILSYEPVHKTHDRALCYKDAMIVNIFPQTLERPLCDQINALAHELTHITHQMLDLETLGECQNKGMDVQLNPYDCFCLGFLDEAGAHINGQLAAYPFTPLEKGKPYTVSLVPLLGEKGYWRTYYERLLHNVSIHADYMQAMQSVHTPAFYALQKEYFAFHPEICTSKLTRRVHKGFKMATKIIQEDLQSHPQKIASHQFCKIYEPVVRNLEHIAVRLKV